MSTRGRFIINLIYKVVVNTDDMGSGNKLYVCAKNKDTGEYTLVNDKTYTVSKNGNVNISMSVKKKYVLLNEEEMRKLTDEILETVQIQETKVTIKVNKKDKVVLADALNMKNVEEITYTSSDKKVATISKTGVIKGKKAGKAVIKVVVTLKNGATKTLKMRVVIK